MRTVIWLLACVSSAAMAATLGPVPNAKVNYYGLGANTCGQYLDDRLKDGKPNGVRGAFYASWFKGYVSGFNQLASQQVSVQLEPARVLAYFDQWCRRHPAGAVVGASVCLIAASGGEPTNFNCKP